MADQKPSINEQVESAKRTLTALGIQITDEQVRDHVLAVNQMTDEEVAYTVARMSRAFLVAPLMKMLHVDPEFPILSTRAQGPLTELQHDLMTCSVGELRQAFQTAELCERLERIVEQLGQGATVSVPGTRPPRSPREQLRDPPASIRRMKPHRPTGH